MIRLAALATVLVAGAAWAAPEPDTPAEPASAEQAQAPEKALPPAVEAGIKELGASMSHWALLCPPDSADPRLKQFSADLGDLRQRLDHRPNADQLTVLKKDFEAWKEAMSQAMYRASGYGDPVKFRAQLEEDLHGIAAVSEKSHVTERDLKTARQYASRLKRIVSPAQADYVFENAIPRAEATGMTAGHLAEARAAGDDGLARIFSGYRFNGYIGQPRTLSPEQAAAPGGPAIPASYQTPSDDALLAFVTRPRSQGGWGFSKSVAWLVIKTAHGFGVNPMIPLSMMRQESGGDTGAVSNKGASGAMQLMPATARSLGVPQGKLFDSAWNVWGGIKYVKQLTAQLAAAGYHGIQYVLAAYNAGPGAVFKSGGVPRYTETMGYVAKISANLAELSRKVPASKPA